MTTTDIYQALASITAEDVETWFAYFGEFVLAGLVFAALSLKGARRAHAFALSTETKADDEATARLVRVAQRVSDCFAFVAAWLPQIAVAAGGVREAMDAVKLPPPPKRPRAPRGASTLLILLVVLPFTNVSSGCAGGAKIAGARTALLSIDGIVDSVNEEVGEAYGAAHDRAMRDATRDDGTLDEERYTRLMRPWVRADAAITTAQVALRASAAAVESAAAGFAGDILGTFACSVEALTELAELLPVLDVEVPALLQTSIGLLRGFAGELCPDAPASDPPEEDREPEVPAAEATS